MYKSMYVAASGAKASQLKLDTIANNLANVNTPGFKNDKLVFESYLNKQKTESAGVSSMKNPNPAHMRQAEYVAPAEQYTDFSQGPLRVTDSPLDVALQGDGFIAVSTFEGERYTRNGTMQVGPNGELVTSAGNVVVSDRNEPIFVNYGFVTIDEDGNVWVRGGSGVGHFDGKLSTGVFGENAGRIKLVDFPKPYGLVKEGSGLFRAPDPNEALAPEGLKVVQGHLEGSNVNMIRSMTDMILNQRIAETYKKAIQESDRMTSTLILQISRAR
ncbi:Flagellar basal-body rod protein FlgF [hydrothermal vent metagenome]|uniref:Flagellar basal-body rod protein FlgF n=1 Tax=hydrothermal vent metagenome TaxID=652676 RepID=A0A3B1C2F4_9ZZZZ